MKQQLIRGIKDTTNQVLPTLKLGFVRPRGIAIPLDPWLRGTLRWARKVGGNGSIWRPDVRLKLTQPTGAGEYTFWVDSLPNDLLLDAILRVTPTLKAKVSDWDTQLFTITIAESSDELLQAGDIIDIWGWPVNVEGAQLVGSNQIIVSTPLFLGRGDRLEVPIGTDSDSWKWTNGLDVAKAEFMQEDAEGFQYMLTLATGLARAVSTDETVYVRAYPAYFSGKLALPDYSAEYLRVVGPFLVDWMSGALTKQVSYTEYFDLKQYTADLRPVTPMLASEHNGQVNRMPIKSEQMLFWKLVDGTINHQARRAVCTCNDEGHWRMVDSLAPAMVVPSYYATGQIQAVAKASLVNNDWWRVHDGVTLVTFEFKLDGTYVQTPGRTTVDISGSGVVSADNVAAVMAASMTNSGLRIEATAYGSRVVLVNTVAGAGGNVPLVEGVAAAAFAVAGMSGGGGGLKWVITVEAAEVATMWVRFHPNADQEFTLAIGSNVVVPQILASYAPATNLDVRILSEPGAVFRLTDWSLQGSRTSFVETETVVRVTSSQWAAGTLFAKPLWPNFSLVQAVPDIDLMNSDCLIL